LWPSAPVVEEPVRVEPTAAAPETGADPVSPEPWDFLPDPPSDLQAALWPGQNHATTPTAEAWSPPSTEAPSDGNATDHGRRRRTLGERRVAVQPEVVREQLIRVVQRLGFETTVEQATVVEAVRGTPVAGLTLTAARVPVWLRGELIPDGDGVRLHVTVEDRWAEPAERDWGATAVYAQVFDEVEQAIDDALVRLDQGTAVKDATFAFVTDAQVAECDADVVDGMLAVGALIVERPGDMPPELVSQIRSIVAGVEGSSAGRLRVDEADVPIVTFLRRQAHLRATLPSRTLRVCATCRQETHDPERCPGRHADETVVTLCPQCGDRRAETALRSCPGCGFDFRSLPTPDPVWRPRTNP
jgi:hypothetical protein